MNVVRFGVKIPNKFKGLEMKSAIFLLLACALSLSGCQPKPGLVRSEIVTVKTVAYVPVPESLTSYPDAPLAKGQTCGSAVEVARARKDYIAELQAKLDAIRRIEGTKISEASHACPAPAPPATK